MTNIQTYQMWHQSCKYFEVLLVGGLFGFLFQGEKLGKW